MKPSGEIDSRSTGEAPVFLGLAGEHEFVVFEAGEGAESFEEKEHAADEEAHDGDANDEEANPGDGANGFVIEFACVFGGVVDFVRPEKVLREEEVGDCRDEEGGGEDEGALEEEFGVRLLIRFLFDFAGDAFEVEDLVVVEEGIKKGCFGPMGGKDGEAKDEGDGRFLEPKEDGSGGVDRAIFFPKKKGQAASEEDGDEAEDGEEIELLVLEEKPEPIADGEGKGDGEGPHGSNVIELGTVNEGGVFAELAEGEHRNEHVDQNIGERVFFGRLGIGFGHLERGKSRLEGPPTQGKSHSLLNN